MTKAAWSQPGALVWTPQGMSRPQGPVTHLAIGAHPDDLEFMAGHGILECSDLGSGATLTRKSQRGFVGVTVAAGAETPTEKQERRDEQIAAAEKGCYAGLYHLDHSTRDLKNGGAVSNLIQDLTSILQAHPQLEALYTHNPMDKHRTHVVVSEAVIAAARSLPKAQRPRIVYGCEVWRGLDWLGESQKVILDVSAGVGALAQLMKVYRSQLKMKAYDEAVLGRMRANATFLDPHHGDQMTHCAYAVEMSVLLENPQLKVKDWVGGLLNSFARDVVDSLKS